MKKRILLILAVCLLLGGCSTTLMGSDEETPYNVFGELDIMKTPSLRQVYFTAWSLRQLGAYEEAYTIFQQLSDQCSGAATEAARFKWLQDTLVRTDTYIDGELMASEKATYDVYGKLIILSEQRDRENFTRSEDDTYVLTDTWLYDMHIQQTYTEAPYYLTSTYAPDGTIIAVTRTPKIERHDNGVAIWGYTVDYTLDAEGKYIRDSGVDRLHYIPWDSMTHTVVTAELSFEGSYTYDASGQLLRYERVFPDIAGGISWDEYTYDKDGNLLVHESRREGDVFFDPEILWESIVREYRYDKDGNMTFESTLTLRGANAETARRDYIQTVYEYENGHLMKQTQTSEGSETVTELTYTYGDLLVYIIEQKEVPGNGSTASEAGESK